MAGTSVSGREMRSANMRPPAEVTVRSTQASSEPSLLPRTERSISSAARVAASMAMNARSALRRGGMRRGAAPAWVSSM